MEFLVAITFDFHSIRMSLWAANGMRRERALQSLVCFPTADLRERRSTVELGTRCDECCSFPGGGFAVGRIVSIHY